MAIKTQTVTLDLIRSAQRGETLSQSQLAERMQPKVFTYVYRMTQDAHLAEDLCQETMVRFIQHLPGLTIPTPRFLWAWVYKTALNQIRDHYNQQATRQQCLPSVMYKKQSESTGPDRAIRQELLGAVSKALDTLKISYRNILILRCFQDLSYAEIAQSIGNSELGARLLFYRAKRSLTRQLARDGFKKSQVLPGLALFATATVAPEGKAAAVTVSAASLQTGLTVPFLATVVTTKAGIATMALCALSLLTFGTIMVRDLISGQNFHPVVNMNVSPTDIVNPIAVQAAHDPDKSGWQGALVRRQDHQLVPLTLDRWLSQPNSADSTWLHLPQDHWIEVAFNGSIVDGDGDDIYIVEACCHGEKAEVYLADEDGNQFQIGSLKIPLTGEHSLRVYGFDLAQRIPPFTATALRIKTVDPGSPETTGTSSGLELQQIRARVQSHR